MKTRYAFYPNHCEVLIIPVRGTGILPLFYTKVLDFTGQGKHSYIYLKRKILSSQESELK